MSDFQVRRNDAQSLCIKYSADIAKKFQQGELAEKPLVNSRELAEKFAKLIPAEFDYPHNEIEVNDYASTQFLNDLLGFISARAKVENEFLRQVEALERKFAKIRKKYPLTNSTHFGYIDVSDNIRNLTQDQFFSALDDDLLDGGFLFQTNFLNTSFYGSTHLHGIEYTTGILSSNIFANNLIVTIFDHLDDENKIPYENFKIRIEDGEAKIIERQFIFDQGKKLYQSSIHQYIDFIDERL